jgi:hypothetical protein
VAEFAQFVAVTRPGSGLTVAADSNHNQGFIFDLPGIDCTRTVVLMFRVSGNAGSRLIMTNMPVPQFVGPSLIDFVLDNTHTKPRSFHRIVDGENFNSTGNKFEVSLSFAPAANEKIHVSDIVILYHARVV